MCLFLNAMKIFFYPRCFVGYMELPRVLILHNFFHDDWIWRYGLSLFHTGNFFFQNWKFFRLKIHYILSRWGNNIQKVHELFKCKKGGKLREWGKKKITEKNPFKSWTLKVPQGREEELWPCWGLRVDLVSFKRDEFYLLTLFFLFSPFVFFSFFYFL